MWRYLALSVLCGFLSPWLASPATAAEFEVESLHRIVEMHGVWRFRTGDDLRWADPEYDHREWDNILVPRDWRRQGHSELTGMAWYRASIRLNLRNPEVLDELYELGVSIGKVHSAYELYAGGLLLGGAGRLPPQPQAVPDRIRIFSIPPEAIDEQGNLVLALRVWRDPTIGWSSTSGMHEGKYILGSVFDLTKAVYIQEALNLMLAVTYFVFGLYHLYLYASNRRIPEFLWFGITTMLVAVYSIEVSQWKHVVGPLSELPYIAHRKVEYAIIYALPATGLQLVFCLLQYRPGRWLRIYQAGFLLLSLAATFIPGDDVLVHSLFFWQMYSLPALLGVMLMVIWFAAQGNIEARTMAVGWAIFVFTAINDILLAQGLLHNQRLLTFGFAAILASMAISLANRFTRRYKHMDREVKERTEELVRINEKLVDAARSDTLTGLLNRRGFVEAAELEVSRARRSGRNFVIVICDIDRFKTINDQFGHACGDCVLKRTAELLQSHLRGADTVARWGGEEFIFLLPETTLSGGRVLAEKLRDVVERTHFNHGDTALRQTVTLGVAAFDDSMSGFEDCISIADNALYEGKQSGRNRVVVAGDEPPGELPGNFAAGLEPSIVARK